MMLERSDLMLSDSTLSALLPAAVFLPVLAAVVCMVLPRSRQAVAGVVGAVLSAGAGLAVVVAVAVAGPLEHEMAGWAPPVGIALRADGMAAVFVAMTSVVALATMIMAASEQAATGKRPGFWTLAFLSWSGLVGIFLAGDLFNAYVALEVLGLSAVGLVALGGRGAPQAALRYLVVAVVGSMLLLVGIGLIYAATSTLDMQLAGERLSATHGTESLSPATLALILVATGMALKTALVPMHAWLPPAHAGSPPAVSPLMSALVVKGSFYLLLRLWLDVFPPQPTVALVLGILGAVAVIWGSLMALAQKHLKRIVAYSTVSQVGYLFLVFPLLGVPGVGEAALVAVVTMAVAHGLAKAAMFTAAGTLVLGTGTDHVDGFVGAARTQGVLTAGMIMAAVSLIGLPLSLGFSAKWQYLTVAVLEGAWWIVAVLLMGTLLATGYLLRPIAALLRSSDIYDEAARVEPRPRPAAQRWVPFFLGASAVFTGLLAAPLAELTLVGVSGP
ncbi:complex I subunit 5 family protein [Kocuria sp.]|uniref:complex I subunit 5 family protein n=1 Tax=Kocuria sp. TaxID=1871328 RepID=UPI0026DFAB8B|nr:proton-conducting transporter membrane subunit [Kocuria sp.]MDO5619615.1 proton-conducting transporter membrane subunit [Kocuria sp.]